MQSNEFNQFLGGVRDIATTLALRLWGGGVDVPATLFIERDDGSCCLSPIDNQHMSSHEAKHGWFLLYLPAILRAESAKRYAILSEAWAVKPEARAHLDAWWAEGHTSLSEHPARIEVLVIAGFDREHRIVYNNTIKRVGKRRSRRRLTGWRIACEGDDVGGRMALGIDALVEASLDERGGAERPCCPAASQTSASIASPSLRPERLSCCAELRPQESDLLSLGLHGVG